MGAVKKCIHPLAKNPIFLESAGISFYSIEELAYYLYENIYLADEELLGEELYLWVERELKLPDLAGMLRDGMMGQGSIYDQVMLILKSSGYYSEKELTELSEKINKISTLQAQERMKHKADELLRNHNLWGAIKEYEKILEIRQNSRLEPGFYAAVWNNLGVCYGKVFLFEKAAVCYENAWKFKKTDSYKERAYYARKLSQYDQPFQEEILETKLSEEFIKSSVITLKELEKKCFEELNLDHVELFLKEREQKYKK